MIPPQMYHPQQPIPPPSYYVHQQYQPPAQFVPMNYSQGPMPQQVRYDKPLFVFFKYFSFVAARKQMMQIINHLFKQE
jgi:hypothetical protein